MLELSKIQHYLRFLIVFFIYDPWKLPVMYKCLLLECMFLGKHDPSTYKSTPDWGWRKKKASYCDWGTREVICYYQTQLIYIFRAVIKILWPTDHLNLKPRLLSVKPLDQVNTWIGYTVYSPHSVIHPSLCCWWAEFVWRGQNLFHFLFSYNLMINWALTSVEIRRQMLVILRS